MRRRTIVLVAAATLVTLLLVGCPGPLDPDGDPTAAELLLEAMQGTWVATETVEFYGGTIKSTLTLVVSESAIAFGVEVREEGTLMNNLDLTGEVTVAEGSATLTYTGGTQAADNGDGSFDTVTPADLSAGELEQLMADLGGVRTASATETTLVIDEGLATELLFVKQ